MLMRMIISRPRTPVIAIAIFLLVTSIVTAAQFQAGAAETDITPPPGAPMAGYYSNRAASGTLDPLHAKAIVLDIDGSKAVLVACDVASLPHEIVDQARRIVEAKTGIPGGRVMISATHSHTGPVILTVPSRYNLEGDMKRIATEYTAGLPARIADAVIAANAHLEPAIVRATIGREDTLPFNRRYFLKDGTVGWNPGKLNPQVVRPAGPIDPTLPVVFVESVEGKAIAAYVNYSMHPDTTGGLYFSADYAATLTKILRAAKGDQLITIFTMGTAGNVNHIDVNDKARQSSPQEAARIGGVLAGEVLKAWKKAQPVAAARIEAHSEVVKLPLREQTAGDVAWAKTTNATFGTAQAAPFIDLVRAGRISDVEHRDGRPWDAEVQVIALNRDIAFVGLPAEVFVELGLMVKQGSAFPNTIIATQTNGAMSYLPNRKAFDEGAYEVVSSRCAPGSGEMLVDSALRQLLALARRQP